MIGDMAIALWLAHLQMTSTAGLLKALHAAEKKKKEAGA
jgi:hypothetical protein